MPDITGTENIDPMTTSMDGIEDLPTNEEAQVPHMTFHPFPSAGQLFRFSNHTIFAPHYHQLTFPNYIIILHAFGNTLMQI